MAAVRSLLRSSASLLRAAPALARSSATTRPSLRRALAAPPRLLRSPVESSFCVESLLPLHTATAGARMTSMLAAPGQGLGWLTQGTRTSIVLRVLLCLEETGRVDWKKKKWDVFFFLFM
ncbi:protein NUCLEAR FUSION DEFECTIVE 6, mitochondrial-like isoform X1 [Zea mays]|uniref:Protein NUCLEAR FUSION DEFECTIVE 6 chloroplastic/mitochondrial n=1 Tax=Zea mays TaxID=4577 RepID=B6TSE7_MAIZE|nr:uncharacterized protein LOC107198085 isoform X1 [Zea mays]ACG40030.1 hypothetical protein [Zea mays]